MKVPFGMQSCLAMMDVICPRCGAYLVVQLVVCWPEGAPPPTGGSGDLTCHCGAQLEFFSARCDEHGHERFHAQRQRVVAMCAPLTARHPKPAEPRRN